MAGSHRLPVSKHMGFRHKHFCGDGTMQLMILFDANASMDDEVWLCSGVVDKIEIDEFLLLNIVGVHIL